MSSWVCGQAPPGAGRGQGLLQVGVGGVVRDSMPHLSLVQAVFLAFLVTSGFSCYILIPQRLSCPRKASSSALKRLPLVYRLTYVRGSYTEMQGETCHLLGHSPYGCDRQSCAGHQQP